MTKMPPGTKATQNDSDAILKWIFNREFEARAYTNKLKDSETSFRVRTEF
jgi:hypothetical protein